MAVMAPRSSRASLGVALLALVLALAFGGVRADDRKLLQASAPKAAFKPARNTVLGFICNEPSTTKFCTAATTARGDPRLNLNDPTFLGTVFVPTDQGIIKNAQQVRDQLKVNSEEEIWNDPKLAGRFVANHVIPGRALASEALDKGATLKSALGQEVKVGDTSWWNTITTLGGLFAKNDIVVAGEGGNKVKVVRSNIPVGRAEVHIVDGPIIPKRDSTWLSWVPIIG